MPDERVIKSSLSSATLEQIEQADQVSGVVKAIDMDDPVYKGGVAYVKMRTPDSTLAEGRYNSGMNIGYADAYDLDQKVRGMVRSWEQNRLSGIAQINRELKDIGKTSGLPQVDDLTQQLNQLKTSHVWAYMHRHTRVWESDQLVRQGLPPKKYNDQNEVFLRAFKSQEEIDELNANAEEMEARPYDNQRRVVVFDWRVVS